MRPFRAWFSHSVRKTKWMCVYIYMHIYLYIYINKCSWALLNPNLFQDDILDKLTSNTAKFKNGPAQHCLGPCCEQFEERWNSDECVLFGWQTSGFSLLLERLALQNNIEHCNSKCETNSNCCGLVRTKIWKKSELRRNSDFWSEFRLKNYEFQTNFRK